MAAMQRLLKLLALPLFLLLANYAGLNNGQIIYASPPPPVLCSACDTCENPCTPVVPVVPVSPPPPSPPPPAVAQGGECPPPPDTYGYAYSPPPPVRPASQYPYYPYYTISRSAPLVYHGSAFFFLVSPLILILSLWFSFLAFQRHHRIHSIFLSALLLRVLAISMDG